MRRMGTVLRRREEEKKRREEEEEENIDEGGEGGSQVATMSEYNPYRRNFPAEIFFPSRWLLWTMNFLVLFALMNMRMGGRERGVLWRHFDI